MIDDLKNALADQGFTKVSDIITAYPTFSNGDTANVRRVYCPYIDKKSNGLIAISGIVGLIDIEFDNNFKKQPIGINIIGRHLLSIVSDNDLPWIIERSCEAIYNRIGLVKSFIEILPENEEAIIRDYMSGRLIEMKSVFDNRAFEVYIEYLRRYI